MAEELHEGDIGTDLIAFARDGSAIIDLSSYSNYYYKFKKANATNAITIVPDLLTDGTDGGLIYTTVTDFLVPAGTWEWQLQLVSPTGSWHSNIRTFVVHRNL